jgi:hypothetical protein
MVTNVCLYKIARSSDEVLQILGVGIFPNLYTPAPVINDSLLTPIIALFIPSFITERYVWQLYLIRFVIDLVLYGKKLDESFNIYYFWITHFLTGLNLDPWYIIWTTQVSHIQICDTLNILGWGLKMLHNVSLGISPKANAFNFSSCSSGNQPYNDLIMVCMLIKMLIMPSYTLHI